MPRLTATMKGMPKAAARVERLLVATERADKLALQDLALIVTRRAKLRLKSPVSGLRKGTGRLSRAIFWRVEDRQPRYAVIGVHASVPYGRIQELGGTTAPHLIKPRVKKALAWPTGRASAIYKFSRFHGRTAKQSQSRARKAHPGEFAFAAVVRHPGSVIRGQFYLRGALDETRPEVQPTYLRRLQEATRRGA
jgi:hypothetical protein